MNTKPKIGITPQEHEQATGKTKPSGEGFSLPCLYRNNSIEIKEKTQWKVIKTILSKQKAESQKYRKTSVALSVNVQEMAIKYGLENLGFLTLTFKDHVTNIKDASHRFNSLASNILNIRYKGFIKVMERQKSGRIHFHLIIALSSDVRTGFDFVAISKSNYKSANKFLRSEWLFWRKTAPKYRFGRTELLPIKSSSEAIGRYVGKYISKHLESRVPEDKGARLVSYSKTCRTMNTKFGWVTEGATQWRLKVRAFAYLVSARTGCEPTMEGLKAQFGPKWAYNHRQIIADMPV